MAIVLLYDYGNQEYVHTYLPGSLLVSLNAKNHAMSEEKLMVETGASLQNPVPRSQTYESGAFKQNPEPSKSL